MASHFTKLFLFYFKFIVNSDPYSYTCSVRYSIQFLVYFQCCGAGAGGAEIILGPGAGAENKF